MTDEKVERINVLYRKSKTPEGLTEAEKEEQKRLRAEYIAAVKASLAGQLEHTELLRPDGTVTKISKRKKGVQ